MNEPCFVCEESAGTMLLVESRVGLRRVPLCVDCYDGVTPEGRGLRTVQDIMRARDARQIVQELSIPWANQD